MRVAYYSPMAEPDAQAASGTERMSALLQQALREAGCEIVRPLLPRTYEGRGDADAQARIKRASEEAARQLLDVYRAGALPSPELWFSYHVYYKSPDWIGPAVAHALGIPYVVAEGSQANKRAGGPWALGHEGATKALCSAARLFAMTAFDRYSLDQLAPGRVRDLKPFIDVTPFSGSARVNDPVEIVTVGMMRNERKRASYTMLAAAMRLLADVPLRLTIAGDGSYRGEIEAMFQPPAPGHEIRFLGAVGGTGVVALLARSDIFAWPGLGEAYGLVFLEAQAAGLPVVACRDRGVPDAVLDGETAFLSAANDAAAYAANMRRLVEERRLRADMGARARRFVREERSVAAAATILRKVVAELPV